MVHCLDTSLSCHDKPVVLEILNLHKILTTQNLIHKLLQMVVHAINRLLLEGIILMFYEVLYVNEYRLHPIVLLFHCF